MRAHTRTKRTIVPGGILALSLAVALLAATASTASADRVLFPWYCPPSPTPPTSTEQIPEGCLDPYNAGPGFDFGDRQVGTTSPAQGFALGVGCIPNIACNDAFTPNISVSGDYAQTNDCPLTLSVTAHPQIQGCLITVTFTPTGTGPKHGTLSTGPGGPTVALTGNGVTTPTPPVLPLQVFLEYRNDYLLWKNFAKKFIFTATTNNDSTLVATGSKIKKTTKQLAAGEPTRIKAKLKHPKQLRKKARVKCGHGRSRTNEHAGAAGGARPGCPGAKIKVKATDEFGQTATEEIKVKFESF
jgi:hypothetical protein